MEEIVYFVEKIVWGIPIIVLLMFTHIFFTVKLKFPQKNILKGFKNMIYSSKDNSKVGISSFKSTMTVLAGTLGIGNIVGVSTAIILGGVGSIFWIFISGFFAIATKYAETYIVLKYRKKKKESNMYYGGTMYILDERIGNKNLAVIFSTLLIISSLGMGALIQSNSISNAICDSFYININVIGIITVFLSTYLIFGNEKRISNVSSFFIPIAVLMYILCCILLLIRFNDNIISAIKIILKEAFNFKSATGGILSSVAVCAITTGMSKGLFTNEAGMGTSPLFDVTVSEQDIKKQSVISSTTVFIDTVIICTITGIVFVSSNMYNNCYTPSALAKSVFSLLPFGKYMYTFFISIFAFSTIPCSGYYGCIGIRYLFKNKKIYEYLYKIVYLVFVYIGCISKSLIVWSISSIANGLMIIPNIYMLFYLHKEIE